MTFLRSTLTQFLLIAALVGAGVFSVKQCSRAGQAETHVARLAADSASLKRREIAAYSAADSIKKANEKLRTHLQTVVAVLPPAAVADTTRRLLTELGLFDPSAQK